MGHTSHYLGVTSSEMANVMYWKQNNLADQSPKQIEFYVVKHGKLAGEEKKCSASVYSFESCAHLGCYLGFYKDGTVMPPRMAVLTSLASRFVIEVTKK
jgi:hypothetical protein